MTTDEFYNDDMREDDIQDEPRPFVPRRCVRVTRSVPIPNPLQLARCAKSPEYGPRILFFSGGSALNPLCRKLIDYTHNSVHLITPFDSGGSSASLRVAFDMLAVGDLRNRLMALADHSVIGQPAVFELFAHRFDHDTDPARLRDQLQSIIDGVDPMIRQVVNPLRKLIRNHLRYFLEHAPADFDLRGASIGNLILVGGYLNNGRQIDPVIFLFSKLVEVRGIVRPVVGRSAQLAARLRNGETICGQHRITGKEVAPLGEPIESIHLVDNCDSAKPKTVVARQKVVDLIASAELICYPMGSFFTSVLANLLPEGICAAIAANDCPKIYIPNTGVDPELTGITVEASVRKLIEQLQKPTDAHVESLLNFVLLDNTGSAYSSQPNTKAIQSLGVEVITAPLVTQPGSTQLDPDGLLETLLSLT
ncbi:MAG TPA: GAK system CofD-like protein [Phycisphaerae bacterium]|nr:GAK system CofD-like protein [Phycisphaerae bacterium]